MFKTDYKKLLNLNDEEYEEYLKRSAVFLKKKSFINKAIFESHLFILSDIMTKRDKRKSQEKKYKTKNMYVLKYLDEIVMMREEQSMGYQTISKALKINHRVDVSKSTIERFCRLNNIEKGSKDG